MSAATSSSSSVRTCTSLGFLTQQQEDELLTFLLGPDALNLIRKNNLKLVPVDQHEESCANCQQASDTLNLVSAENEKLRELVSEGAIQLAQLKSEKMRTEETEDNRVKTLEKRLKEKEEENGRIKMRMQEIIERTTKRDVVLSTEKETLTRDKFKFSAFARQVKELSRFDDPNFDLLENNQLERMVEHLEPILKERDSQHMKMVELGRNRELMERLGDIFNAAQNEWEMPTQVPPSSLDYYATTSNSLHSTAQLLGLAANTPPNTPATTVPSSSFSSQLIVTRNCVPPRSPLAAQVATSTTANSSPQAASTTGATEGSLGTRSSSKKGKRSGKRKRRNGRYNCHNGQYTQYAVSTQPHGVDKEGPRFKCLCRNLYSNKKSLHAHIRKMTKAWEFKCGACNHYFFYQYELDWHVSRSARCKAGSGHSPPQTSLPFRPVPSADPLSDEQIQMQVLAAPTIVGDEQSDQCDHEPSSIVITSTYTVCQQQNTTAALPDNTCASALQVQKRIVKKKRDDLSSLKSSVLAQARPTHKNDSPNLATVAKGGAGETGSPSPARVWVTGRRGCEGSPTSTSTSSVEVEPSSYPTVQTPSPKQAANKIEIIEVASDDDHDMAQDAALISAAVDVSSPAITTTPSSSGQQVHEVVELGDANREENVCRCGKKCPSRGALMLHIKTMKYNKVFACSDCSHGYLEYAQLQMHMTQAHNAKLEGFKCGFCGLCVTSPKTFRMHLVTFHDRQ